MKATSFKAKFCIDSLLPKENTFIKQLTTWLELKQVVVDFSSHSDALLRILLVNLDQINESEKAYIVERIQKDEKIIILDAHETNTPFYKILDWLKQGVIDVLHYTLGKKIIDILLNRYNRCKQVEEILSSEEVKTKLIGESPIWKKTLRQVIEFAAFGDSSILILGESGTGKELVAKLIHHLDQKRTKKEMVLLDCSTIVPELFGSEFFGHEKGAFTNAISMREGAFALANNSSLFLDEVGELPLPLQAALLRVIQEGTYKRLGSNAWRKSKFRLIGATNKNLQEMILKGEFRLDLYYRIGTCIVELPPLEKRKLDIPELAAHFFTEAHSIDEPVFFDRSVIHYLLSRSYPGNVRELRQLIYRIANRYPGKGPVTLGCIPPSDLEVENSSPKCWLEPEFMMGIRNALANLVDLKTIKRTAGDIALQLAVEEAGGKLSVAAQRLGVSDRLVQNWWAKKNAST